MSSSETTPTNDTCCDSSSDPAAPAQAQSAPAPAAPAPAAPEKKPEQPQLNLLEVPITDEHAALNVIVGFLGIAQKRGTFAINESAKIFECVKMFQRNQSS
jgi:hypothetical protein